MGVLIVILVYICKICFRFLVACGMFNCMPIRRRQTLSYHYHKHINIHIQLNQHMEPAPFAETGNTPTVEGVIRTTLSCLAFLRGIFSEVCFNDKVIEFDESQSLSQSSQQGKMIRLKTLLNNKSQATDLYNSWIDSIIKVFNDGYLQSIILNIYDDRKVILECFTLELTNQGFELKIHRGSHESATTVLQRFGFAKIMKKFIAAIQILPEPNESTERLVEMKIVHNSTCPSSYKVYEFAMTRQLATRQPNTHTTQKNSSSGEQTLLYDTATPFKEIKSRTSCECGTYEPDSKKLIKCRNCRYYVHPSCYGFLRNPVGVEVICFTCLHTTNPELLYVAKTIILLRRIAKLRAPRQALKPYYTQSISNKLGIPLKASSLLHAKLKELGYYSPNGIPSRKQIDPLLFANSPRKPSNHPYSSMEPSLIQQLKNTGVFEINYRNDIDSIST